MTQPQQPGNFPPPQQPQQPNFQQPGGVPPQAPNYAQQQPVGGPGYAPAAAPANEYTGFSIGAVVTMLGAVLVLASYPMVWAVAKLDSGATVTGFGTKTNGSIFQITEVSMGRLHWLAGVAMLGLIGVALARLMGKFSENLKRLPIIFGVLAILSAGFTYISLGSDFKAGSGLYLALVGAIIALAGGLVMSLLKK
ncbi:hypothetical protein nbrc107696_05850 [Gordonia spumicola]|uniref:Uncharacterized protein n=1 Tax=Gordonia spumicola TaxID=589161 RepID=A0A7I9V3Y6_9ACTN|nr:hypothetical protein [Gordonia spumicola]GEE00139.1 hypothetical protein nbrc107696_05850 [Gordonia spumicola]